MNFHFLQYIYEWRVYNLFKYGWKFLKSFQIRDYSKYLILSSIVKSNVLLFPVVIKS
jgi:hypothetical protein